MKQIKHSALFYTAFHFLLTEDIPVTLCFEVMCSVFPLPAFIQLGYLLLMSAFPDVYVKSGEHSYRLIKYIVNRAITLSKLCAPPYVMCPPPPVRNVCPPPPQYVICPPPPPPQYVVCPPITQHVRLYSKSCKNMARRVGGGGCK